MYVMYCCNHVCMMYAQIYVWCKNSRMYVCMFLYSYHNYSNFEVPHGSGLCTNLNETGSHELSFQVANYKFGVCKYNKESFIYSHLDYEI